MVNIYKNNNNKIVTSFSLMRSNHAVESGTGLGYYGE